MSQFRIDEKISESGSTTVYRAYQETLERPILLKVLHPHLANDPVVRERFAREAKACAHLRSDHIVQVYDLTEYNGCPAIVMEYVHGQSLKDVIAANPPDRDQLMIKTAADILQALSVAHHRGIVHRDIKPGNILLAEDGKIKLTDFGLAYVAHAPTVTVEGSVLGTPAYMAPEQIRGERVDARTDFFSLGVTLVEISTGQRIFEGSTYSECVRKISDFRPDHLDRLTTSIPPAYLSFLKRLMDPDPGKRYSSAAEALKDLGVKVESAPRNLRVFPVSRRTSLSVLAAVCVVGIAGVVYFRAMNSRTPVEQPGQIQELVAGDSVVGHPSQQLKTGDLAVGAKEHRATMEQGRSEADRARVIPVAARKDSIRIVFTSNPWAKVYVDGRLVGETPFAQPVYLVLGKHAITFSNPVFDPILKNIDVTKGQVQVVSADFLQNAGYLFCTVQPWAEVYVDEQYKDTTPLNKPIILTAGVHHVRLHNSAFLDSMQTITIKAKDTLKINVTLKTPT